jgi:hypothetical protein
MRLKLLAAALAVAAVVLAVPLFERYAARPELPTAPDRFDVGAVTWAQGSTLHHGMQDYDLGPHIVRRMTTSPHGFFVSVVDSPADDSTGEVSFFDGEALTDVPGDVDLPLVSPDGRYAGWVDRDGPWRPAGRIAEIVVVDLTTGDAVFRDHEHMGGGLGDDLGARYSEIPPAFLGFDDDGYAYWRDAEGGGNRWRVALATGVKKPAGPDPDSDAAVPPEPGGPYDPRAGRRVWMTEDAIVDREGDGVTGTGYLSPDGRYVVRLEQTGRPRILDAASLRRVHPDHGRRWAFFGGWAGPSEILLLVRERFEDSWDPSAADTTEGTLVRCELSTARCRDLVDVVGTRSVVFGTGMSTIEPS